MLNNHIIGSEPYMSNSVMNEEQKRQKRLTLVADLRNAGYTSAKSISDELKDKGYEHLDISRPTIDRDLRRIRETGRDFIENIILNGEFIVEHHEALEEFKRVRNRVSEEIPKAKLMHKQRDDEITALAIDEDEKMRLKLQNDSMYHSAKQNNERISIQATKEYTQLFNKTETVWGLKKFIKENDPKMFNKPELQNVINELEEKNGDQ